ncbi:unnamed protein product [Thlaspi arvense]|uniref:SWIM-type domain-containing protein n=1 Tax=Thlaspi arvense TaxID=13288 RepID=A0AAU9RNS3_THLAR|nr:unnamed protein product [Thlaspi arvense]
MSNNLHEYGVAEDNERNAAEDSERNRDNSGESENESSEELLGLRMQEDSDSDTEDSSNEMIAFRVGQAFSSKDSFRKVIDKYVVDMKRNRRYKRSETIKVSAICAEKGCPWNIYESINRSSKDMVYCDAVENNISKSFNNVINERLFKPLVGLLEDIRIHVMISNEGNIRMINGYKGEKKVKDCTLICGGRGWYEVDYGRDKCSVSVRNEISCTCRRYKVSGITCSHMISALLNENISVRIPESLVSKWFSIPK